MKTLSITLLLIIFGCNQPDKNKSQKVKDEIMKKIETDFKSGKAQKIISNLKKSAANEQPEYEKVSMEMAKLIQTNLKINQSFLKVNFVKESWNSISFARKNKSAKYQTCLSVLKTIGDKSQLLITINEKSQYIKTSSINSFLKENFDKIIKCNILRVTVMPKFPHRVSFNTSYDNKGKVLSHSELEYWQ